MQEFHMRSTGWGIGPIQAKGYHIFVEKAECSTRYNGLQVNGSKAPEFIQNPLPEFRTGSFFTVHQIVEKKPGDVVFHCSDGCLFQIDQAEFSAIPLEVLQFGVCVNAAQTAQFNVLW